MVQISNSIKWSMLVKGRWREEKIMNVCMKFQCSKYSILYNCRVCEIKAMKWCHILKKRCVVRIRCQKVIKVTNFDKKFVCFISRHLCLGSLFGLPLSFCLLTCLTFMSVFLSFIVNQLVTQFICVWVSIWLSVYKSPMSHLYIGNLNDFSLKNIWSEFHFIFLLVVHTQHNFVMTLTVLAYPCWLKIWANGASNSY